MKKIFNNRELWILLFYFLFVPISWAQNDEDVNKLDPQAREKIRSAQIAFITDRLGLTPAEAEKFWPVYNEFAQKRNNIRQEMHDARANRPADQKDEDFQKEMIDLQFKLKQRELDLEKEYSNKILNVITPQKLIALRKAEADFRTMVIRQIQQRQMRNQRQQDFRDKNDQRLQRRNN
jgi:hypothetical protein